LLRSSKYFAISTGFTSCMHRHCPDFRQALHSFCAANTFARSPIGAHLPGCMGRMGGRCFSKYADLDKVKIDVKESEIENFQMIRQSCF
jgi:hypothetical protein